MPGRYHIVRISGDLVGRIASAVLGHVPQPRLAELHDFKGEHDEIIDSGIALFFPAPHSFTGEDVLELQGHGGPVVMDMLLQRVLQLGARAARPGEFSLRAFMNNKIDLAQAEAIADLIDSASAQAARSAISSLQGEFSRRIHTLVEKLTELRMFIEAAIDFPDDEIDFLNAGHVAERLQCIADALQTTISAARQGCLMRDGMTVVIAGISLSPHRRPKPMASCASALNSINRQAVLNGRSRRCA